MLTSARTYEPAWSGWPEVPTAFLLKIFSTAVKPWPSWLISLDVANTGGTSMPSTFAAKVWSFLPNTIAYDPPARMNSIFCGVSEDEMSISSSPSL